MTLFIGCMTFPDDIKLRILYASAIIEYKLDKYETAFENWQKALNMRYELTISSISERYTQICHILLHYKTSLWNCIILKRRSAF